MVVIRKSKYLKYKNQPRPRPAEMVPTVPLARPQTHGAKHGRAYGGGCD